MNDFISTLLQKYFKHQTLKVCFKISISPKSRLRQPRDPLHLSNITVVKVFISKERINSDKSHCTMHRLFMPIKCNRQYESGSFPSRFFRLNLIGIYLFKTTVKNKQIVLLHLFVRVSHRMLLNGENRRMQTNQKPKFSQILSNKIVLDRF